MIADSAFRQGVPYDVVGLDKSSTSLLAALEIEERKALGLIIAEASHLIIIEPFWTTGREEQVIEHAHRLPQKRQFHLLSALTAPELEEDPTEAEVELPDLEDNNDRIMKRINAD
ncbi:global transactivator [Fusarium mexicanum]|uniref:Global transactivator n=1 Tax=Fusarium mexicanum TaxID=751941 RepID=A0A8H5MTK6_9HYPO|nr:global transactivator [Fusarium mexicanum]